MSKLVSMVVTILTSSLILPPGPCDFFTFFEKNPVRTLLPSPPPQDAIVCYQGHDDPGPEQIQLLGGRREEGRREGRRDGASLATGK